MDKIKAASCLGVILAWVVIAIIGFIVCAVGVAVGAWCFGYAFHWKYAVFGAVVFLIITVLRPSKK